MGSYGLNKVKITEMAEVERAKKEKFIRKAAHWLHYQQQKGKWNIWRMLKQ